MLVLALSERRRVHVTSQLVYKLQSPGLHYQRAGYTSPDYIDILRPRYFSQYMVR
jgi:hypothetical protein